MHPAQSTFKVFDFDPIVLLGNDLHGVTIDQLPRNVGLGGGLGADIDGIALDAQKLLGLGQGGCAGNRASQQQRSETATAQVASEGKGKWWQHAVITPVNQSDVAPHAKTTNVVPTKCEIMPGLERVVGNMPHKTHSQALTFLHREAY